MVQSYTKVGKGFHKTLLYLTRTQCQVLCFLEFCGLKCIQSFVKDVAKTTCMLSYTCKKLKIIFLQPHWVPWVSYWTFDVACHPVQLCQILWSFSISMAPTLLKILLLLLLQISVSRKSYSQAHCQPKTPNFSKEYLFSEQIGSRNKNPLYWGIQKLSRGSQFLVGAPANDLGLRFDYEIPFAKMEAQ